MATYTEMTCKCPYKCILSGNVHNIMYVCSKIILCIGNFIRRYGHILYSVCWLPVISHSMFISVSAGYFQWTYSYLCTCMYICMYVFVSELGTSSEEIDREFMK